jgi:hypothetical protein
VMGRMRHRVVSVVFEAWAIYTEAHTRERKEEKRVAEERRAYAIKESKFLSKLTQMGATWFAQMAEASELSDFGGPRGLITSISADVGAEIDRAHLRVDEARQEALLTAEEEANRAAHRMNRRGSWSNGWRKDRPSNMTAEDEALNRLRSRMTHRTVLDLLDSRYMAPGGQLHGRHIEAEFNALETRLMDEMAACNEQYTYMRLMFQEIAKTSGLPSLLAVDRERARHTLRPLKQPPRMADLGLSLVGPGRSAEQLTQEIDQLIGTTSPPLPRTMAVSKSSAAVLLSNSTAAGGVGGELNPVKPKGSGELNPVRTPPKESVELWGV